VIRISQELSKVSEKVSFYDRQIVYLISLTASLGSLSASMIFGWDTFALSLAQRILMYPVVVISGLGILLDREDLMTWILVLSVPGMAVSLYHYLNVRLDTLIGCGFALPCSTASRIVFNGFTLRPMYLPLLAFFAFTLITAVLLLGHRPDINKVKEKAYSWI
jgi:disulfide bond formation protein DsbB